MIRSQKIPLETFESIPNPIDFLSRKANFDSIPFQNDYKSGYTPIEIQQTQEKEFSSLSKKNTHFIRKKQSCASINLKRTCGVSYVKPSESLQLDVNEIFPRLPPLVFQCSSECDEIMDLSIYGEAFQRLFQKGTPIICTVLEEEENIRDYLLFPLKRTGFTKGRIVVLKDFKELWVLFFDKLFIVLHLFYDHKGEKIVLSAREKLKEKGLDEELWGNYMGLIEESDMQIGILLKKNLSGKKSFVKTLGPDFSSFLEEEIEGEKPINELNSIINDEKEDKKELKTKENTEKPSFFVSLTNKLQAFFSSKGKASPEHALEEDIINTNSLSTGFNSPLRKQTKVLHGINPSILSLLQKDPKTKNMNTCSVRLELFLSESLWKGISLSNRNNLNGLILYIEHSFQKESLYMSNKRMEAFENSSNLALELGKIRLFDNGNQKGRELLIEDLFIGKKTSSFGLPLYYISTRDCFAFDLIEKKTFLGIKGREKAMKIEYFFSEKAMPQNFKGFLEEFKDRRVGVTCYTDFFTNEELIELEKKTFETEIKCFKSIKIQNPSLL